MKGYRLLVYSLFLFLYAGLMFFFPRPAGPRIHLYGGNLGFDGERAFADLQTIADRFPSRFTSSAAYDSAVAWTVGRLETMGLHPIVQEFALETPWSAEDALDADGPAPGRPGHGLWNELRAPLTDPSLHTAQGYNVTALLPGKTAEVVVVFAHLDSVPWAPGADDNASGVAVLLELARLLTAEKPRYTYAFVAFGSEEEGLWGSRAWIAEYVQGPDQLLSVGGTKYGPVRLAVGMDCVGYSEGEKPQMYSLALGKHRLETNTLALVAAAMESRDPGWRGRYAYLGAQLTDAVGIMPSDQLSFLQAGVSAISFGRASREGSDSPYVNTSEDTLAHVSGETLLDAGRFAERFLRTLEEADLPAWPVGRSAIMHPRGFTPGWMLVSAALLLATFLAANGAPALVGPQRCRLRAELGWYGLAVAWSVALAAAYNLVYVPGVPVAAVLVPWLVAAVASMVALTWLRLKRFRPESEGVNDYLSLALAVWVVAGTLLLGPARAVFVLFWPAVLYCRLRGRHPGVKVVFRLALIVWAGVLVLSSLAEGSVAGQFGIGSHLAEVAGRAWFLGLGLLVFPAVWQATAREPGRRQQPERACRCYARSL